MKKSLSMSHRFSCAAFAIAVFAALYSIGSLVYGSDPVVTQGFVAKPTAVATSNTVDENKVSTLSLTVEELAAFEENDESGDEDQIMEESWPAEVLAEMAGSGESETIQYNTDQPPVTDDNVNAKPGGEFAEQILAGEMRVSSFEGEAFGFDPDMQQPDSDNAAVEPKPEFADQIRQHDIAKTAALSGYEADNESYIALKEVDEASAPPTETGAFISPED